MLKRIQFRFCVQAVALLFSMLVLNAYAITNAELTSIPWTMTSLNGKTIDPALYPTEKPNIKFNDDSRFSAWAGCNRMAGSYTFTDPDNLQFSPNTIMTKMACMGAQNVEDEFVVILPLVNKVIYSQDILQFLDQAGTVQAEFAKS